MQALIYSFLAGISTSVGVIILVIFGEPGKKVLSGLLGLAGGIMIAISVFELMPEAVSLGSTTILVVGFILGSLMMFGLDKVVPHSHVSSSEDDLAVENPEKIKIKNPILRTGYLILFGIALHNLPEGLAIGAGLESSPEVGLFIALAIAFHNIPEGLAIAGPLKAGGTNNLKLLLFTLGAGLMTPLGALVGLFFFRISPVFVGGSLAFAAGAMVYIVNDELVPQANGMNSHFSNLGIIAGLLLGFAML
ncbi:MAG: ZIP family metal transporter [Halanaerobiaceae bacterium]